MFRQNRLTKVLAAAALFLSIEYAVAAVNDIFPGDYFPAQPDTTTASVYAYSRHQAGPYVGGDKIFDGRLESSILALRLVRTVKLGDTTVSGVLVLPWADTDVSPAPLAAALGKGTHGLSDVRLGLAAWLINDPANANYLAVSAMAIAPTGHYDARQVVNVGENRWKLTLGGGWQKDITPRFLIELSPEIAFYGDNNDYAVYRRLEQRTSYALTGTLRWRVRPAWHVHVGGQLNRGGATRINGIDQRNPANNERLMAGMTWFLPGKQQLILRMAKDVSIDNGFRTGREIALRLQKSF